MKLSFFNNPFDTDPRQWEGSWDEFVEDFGPHAWLNIDVSTPEAIDAAKLTLPVFSPAEYPPGAKRGKRNVLAVHLLVFDVDEASAEELAEFIEHMDGVELLVCSTFSRGLKPGVRVRVVFPLSRPVQSEEWPVFWSTMQRLSGNIGDTQCRDTSHIYFKCIAPEVMRDSGVHFFERRRGQVLDVDGVLSYPTEHLPAPVAVRCDPIDIHQFEAWAGRLEKSKDDRKADLGRALGKVCRGESFAEAGNRDNTIYTMGLEIAQRFPDGDPAILASHFSRSLELMGRAAADCPTVDNVEYKITRAQDEIRKKKADEEHTKQRQRQERVIEAFKGARDTVYDDAELAQWASVKWIVQKVNSFYFFVNGVYVGPYAESEASNAALKLLAPATKMIQLMKISRGEIRQKSIKELTAEYGTVADIVEVDLRAQESTFDPMESLFTEAPCPLRKGLQPRYHAEIDRWLDLLGGQRALDLKTWVAAVTLLDRPCVALFLTGPADAGKSLLALGLSRLWTKEGPTSLTEVFASFNEALARCPLCFADEQLPKDFRGYTKNGELREHVQAMVRDFKRKFIPTGKLLGATRTIIAANSEDILKTQENLSENDIQAIVDRYLHVPVDQAVVDYLQTVDTWGGGWVEQDLIAEHALWMRDNHPWTPQGRFLIKIHDEHLSRSLATRSGDRSAVCQWLCGYLIDPEAFHGLAPSQMLVRIHKGRLVVNVKGLSKNWTLYVPNDKCPDTGRLSAAIRSLSTGQRTKLNDSRGHQTNYYCIDEKNLIEWSNYTGYTTEEHIVEALKTDTPPTGMVRKIGGVGVGGNGSGSGSGALN